MATTASPCLSLPGFSDEIDGEMCALEEGCSKFAFSVFVAVGVPCTKFVGKAARRDDEGVDLSTGRVDHGCGVRHGAAANEPLDFSADRFEREMCKEDVCGAWGVCKRPVVGVAIWVSGVCGVNFKELGVWLVANRDPLPDRLVLRPKRFFTEGVTNAAGPGVAVVVEDLGVAAVARD